MTQPYYQDDCECGHALAHGSLAALLPELVGRGLVGFDPETGRYFLV